MSDPSNDVRALAPAAKKLKRQGSLPEVLQDVTSEHIFQFNVVTAVDPNAEHGEQPFQNSVAESFEYEVTNAQGQSETKTFDLKTLTLKQMKELCSNLGLADPSASYYAPQSSPSLFQMRARIANRVQYFEDHDDAPERIMREKYRLPGYYCRLINCLFHSEYRDEWLKEIKNAAAQKRQKRRPGEMPFWPLMDAVVNAGEDEDEFEAEVRTWWLPADTSPAYAHIQTDFVGNTALSLNGMVMGKSASELSQYHADLHTVRRKISEIMAKPGNKENDSYLFVQEALDAVNGKVGFLEAYYFYERCRDLQQQLGCSF